MFCFTILLCWIILILFNSFSFIKLSLFITAVKENNLLSSYSITVPYVLNLLINSALYNNNKRLVSSFHGWKPSCCSTIVIIVAIESDIDPPLHLCQKLTRGTPSRGSKIATIPSATAPMMATLAVHVLGTVTENEIDPHYCVINNHHCHRNQKQNWPSSASLSRINKKNTIA